MSYQQGKLQGKVAIITGGASGLGKAIAQRFSAEGAKVVIADIQEENGQTVVNSLVDSYFINVDVSNPQAVERMVNETVKHYGKLDILVNNAGIMGKYASTVEITLENWRKVMGINLDGVYFGMKYGIAAMLNADHGGVVINLASVVGMSAFAGIPPYSAAKAGVIQLSKAAAIEYAPSGIRVNAIAPTAIETNMVKELIANSDDPDTMLEGLQNMNPIPGMPTPEDVAAAALFLASDEANFITGVVLPIDGGYIAR